MVCVRSIERTSKTSSSILKDYSFNWNQRLRSNIVTNRKQDGDPLAVYSDDSHFSLRKI